MLQSSFVKNNIYNMRKDNAGWNIRIKRNILFDFLFFFVFIRSSVACLLIGNENVKTL